MWHPKGWMSAKFAVSQHYKFCVVLRGEVAPAIGPKPPFTVGLSRDRPSERSARHRCLFGLTQRHRQPGLLGALEDWEALEEFLPRARDQVPGLALLGPCCDRAQ